MNRSFEWKLISLKLRIRLIFCGFGFHSGLTLGRNAIESGKTHLFLCCNVCYKDL